MTWDWHFFRDRSNCVTQYNHWIVNFSTKIWCFNPISTLVTTLCLFAFKCVTSYLMKLFNCELLQWHCPQEGFIIVCLLESIWQRLMHVTCFILEKCRCFRLFFVCFNEQSAPIYSHSVELLAWAAYLFIVFFYPSESHFFLFIEFYFIINIEDSHQVWYQWFQLCHSPHFYSYN